MAQVDIHEFSTGITPQKLASGGWVSTEFTGRYMNVTISDGNIPPAVERAIANREFAVAEGATSDRPTVIGRVVNQEWAVVAFITKGRDEKGRSASFYRYFLTADVNYGTSTILAFIQKQGIDPAFNPYPNRPIKPERFKVAGHKNCIARWQTEYTGDRNPEVFSMPAIVEASQHCQPGALDQIASARLQQNGQPIAWAYYVEALEKPHTFQVIYPASANAAQRIRKSLSPTTKSVSANTAVDEQAIRNTVKSIIYSSRPKGTALKIFIESVGEVEQSLGEQASHFWNRLFDSQGSNNALEKKIYSDWMIRLLTLQAIILPETLITFLKWLDSVSNGKSHQNQAEVSFEFQHQIAQFLKGSQQDVTHDFFKKKIFLGVSTLTTSVFNQQIVPLEAAAFLRHQKSLWGAHEPRHSYLTEEVLKASDNVKAHSFTDSWNEIVQGLQCGRECKDNLNTKYISLGEFYRSLERPILADCCDPAEPGEMCLFYSYARKDEHLRDELEMHLKILGRQNLIRPWHDRCLIPGDDWAGEIDQNLKQADIILLLVSPDFIASDGCYIHELEFAMQQHQAAQATVIPIIIRPVDWQGTPFAKLQGLPKEMKPITQRDDRDAAWYDVEQGIKAAIAARRRKKANA